MEQVNERNALVKVIDRIMSQPGLAQKTWSSLENGLIKASSQTSNASKETFDKKIAKISQLPVDFIASFLVEASGGLLSKATVDKIDGHDLQALLRLLCMATKTSPGTPLPAAMQNRKVCSRVLFARHKQVGGRLSTTSSTLR